MIVVSKFSSEWVNNANEIVADVSHPELPEKLFFRCQGSFSYAEKIKSGNGILLSLLWPAMELGEDLFIEGEVTDELLFVANNDLQSLLLDYEPKLKRILVSAIKVTSNIERSNRRVATGFSAGVDSFTTLKIFSAGSAPASKVVNTITTFNVGAMGGVTESAGLFEKYCSRTIDFSKKYSLSWTSIDSNLDDFFKFKNSGFQKTHVLRNVAAAYLMEAEVSNYLYSSSYPFADLNKNNFDMSFIEPILLSLVSTRSMNFESAGAGLSRLQKTKLISGFEPAFEWLDVCVSDPLARATGKFPNCSRCWKCSRLIITLDALHKLDNFKAVLDGEKFKQFKGRAYRQIVRGALKGRPADRDVIQFICEQGVGLSSQWHVTMKYYLNNVMKKIKKGANLAARKFVFFK